MPPAVGKRASLQRGLPTGLPVPNVLYEGIGRGIFYKKQAMRDRNGSSTRPTWAEQRGSKSMSNSSGVKRCDGGDK
eukprot:CAMPEP_0170431882 /NCGR_PEP_ID=MMETSP0117_2-20130122/41646_1 /TAXON_ID=400756 /ORGANISM="Durinskia baltica, Strain CSIRO CS-38" /LENGTH=75 /DNA_ID=CAMNT_0010691483 /DNA_START=88 /DNA_END=313 /DNA_ORIENTATION=+